MTDKKTQDIPKAPMPTDLELYQRGHKIPEINNPARVQEWRQETEAIVCRNVAEFVINDCRDYYSKIIAQLRLDREAVLEVIKARNVFKVACWTEQDVEKCQKELADSILALQDKEK